MKHARAAEFADYLELVPDQDFYMMDSSRCIMGYANIRAGVPPRSYSPKYWEVPKQIFGDVGAARAMYFGQNYYGGLFGRIKNWFEREFDFLWRDHPVLIYATKQDAIRVVRHFAETGNVVWR